MANLHSRGNDLYHFIRGRGLLLRLSAFLIHPCAGSLLPTLHGTLRPRPSPKGSCAWRSKKKSQLWVPLHAFGLSLGMSPLLSDCFGWCAKTGYWYIEVFMAAPPPL